jgi:hypothetical protein
VILLGATAASAAPSITVSPSTGLHNGQTVTVSGSGFTKNGSVYIVECVKGATKEGQCSFTFSDLSTVVVAKADASGNMHSPSPVLKTSFKTVDCTKTPCEIAAHQTLSTALSATNTAVHEISFGAAAHPSTSQSAPATSAHPTGSATSTAAGQPSTSASSGASTSAVASSSASSGAPSTAASSTPTGAATSAALSESASDNGASSPAAIIIKKHPDNGGRYLAVAIVAVLAVLFVGLMALGGKRKRDT